MRSIIHHRLLLRSLFQVLSLAAICFPTILKAAQPAPPRIGISGFHAIFPTTATYHESCTPQPNGTRICSYPSMAPCKDNDRDGVFSCASNTSKMRLISLSEFEDNFLLKNPLPDGPLFNHPAYAAPDWISLSQCVLEEKNPNASGSPSGFPAPYNRCVAQWGFNKHREDDCDDSAPLIGSVNNWGNQAPVNSIVYVGRSLSSVEYAKQNLQVNLNRSQAFNPSDTLEIAIKTHKCVSNLQDVQIYLDLGIGEPLYLRSGNFAKASEYDTTLPSDAPRGDGILYGMAYLPPNEAAFSSDEALLSLLTKIRLKREMAGHKTTTTAGPVAAKIIVKTALGSSSIPISIDTCVPVFGDGPISVTVRRPINLKTNLPNRWLRRPRDFAEAFADYTLEVPPFKQNKQEFSVVADLSLLTERELSKNESGSSNLEVTGPASCGGRFNVYESAFNKLAHAAGVGINLDPTASRYGLKALQLSPEDYLVVATHEFGHAFGHLRDEYDAVGQNPVSDAARAWWNTRNCSSAGNIQTAFPAPGNIPTPARAVCGARGLYRSTLGSMMNDQYAAPKFNVVSCAYLLSELRGGSAASYFSTCQKAEYDAIRE